MRGAGIFCGNFYTGREKFPPCQIMWCVRCYVEKNIDELSKARKAPEVIGTRIRKEDMRKERLVIT